MSLNIHRAMKHNQVRIFFFFQSFTQVVRYKISFSSRFAVTRNRAEKKSFCHKNKQREIYTHEDNCASSLVLHQLAHETKCIFNKPGISSRIKIEFVLPSRPPAENQLLYRLRKRKQQTKTSKTSNQYPPGVTIQLTGVVYGDDDDRPHHCTPRVPGARTFINTAPKLFLVCISSVDRFHNLYILFERHKFALLLNESDVRSRGAIAVSRSEGVMTTTRMMIRAHTVHQTNANAVMSRRRLTRT